MSDREAVVAAYLAGGTTREVAAAHGVDPQTVRRWVLASGNPMRNRGQKPIPDDVVAQVLTLRRRQKMSWAAIGQALGIDDSAARRAYQRATGGDRGVVDHHRHLTAKQADRLRELYERVPDAPGGKATRSSSEGKALAEALAAHRASGVTGAELAEALHLTPGAITSILQP